MCLCPSSFPHHAKPHLKCKTKIGKQTLNLIILAEGKKLIHTQSCHVLREQKLVAKWKKGGFKSDIACTLK